MSSGPKPVRFSWPTSCPAHPPPTAPRQQPPLPSSAWFFATAAAPAPIADAAAPFDPLLTRLLPPMGDPPPGLALGDVDTLRQWLRNEVPHFRTGSR